MTKAKDDSATIEQAFKAAKAPYMKTAEIADSVKKARKKGGLKFNNKWILKEQKYASVAKYDSIQRTLPEDGRDGWLDRIVQHRNIELRKRYKGRDDELIKDLLEKFFHTFPYLLFISLPLYALYLKLLYIRRKQFVYVSHGIFLIYLYIFTFILLLLVFGTDKLRTSFDWGWLSWIEFLLLLFGVYYAYKAMRRFYGQGRLKTFLKFCILNTMAFWSLIFLFVMFFLFAIYKI